MIRDQLASSFALFLAASGLDSGQAHMELLQAVLPEADPDGGGAVRHDLLERPQLWRPGSL